MESGPGAQTCDSVTEDAQAGKVAKKKGDVKPLHAVALAEPRRNQAAAEAGYRSAP